MDMREKLRGRMARIIFGRCDNDWRSRRYRVLREDAFEAADELIAALGLVEVANALASLDAVAAQAFRHGDSQQSRPDNVAAWAFNDAELTWGDVRKARAALAKLTGEDAP